MRYWTGVASSLVVACLALVGVAAGLAEATRGRESRGVARERVLRGRVLDGSGAAFSGLTVVLERQAGGPRAAAVREIASGPTGGFRFDDVKPGRYRLFGRARGYCTSDTLVDIEIPRDGRAELRLDAVRMEPASEVVEVFGRVVHEAPRGRVATGEPVRRGPVD